MKADVGQASGAEAAIAGMVRQADVERSIYVDLTRKANELETERRILTANCNSQFRPHTLQVAFQGRCCSLREAVYCLLAWVAPCAVRDRR